MKLIEASSGLMQCAVVIRVITQTSSPGQSGLMALPAITGVAINAAMSTAHPIRGEERGVSWTVNPETAKRFAWHRGKVYATEVLREDIYAYLGHPESCGATKYRREEEVMVLLNTNHPIRVHEVIGKKKEAAYA